MKPLESPVFEVKQDSKWYKTKQEIIRNENAFYKEINKAYFKDNGFAFYGPYSFGVFKLSADYETFKDELLKNPDKNGIHLFKKRSKYYSIFSEMIEEIGFIRGFKTHAVFGINNARQSQWIGDRWFYSVRNAELVNSDEVEQVDYKKYLQLVVDSLEGGDKG